MQPKLIIHITLLLLTLNWIKANDFPNLKAIHCAGNYPTQNDLHSLLHSLGKIINFSFAHCKHMNENLWFGLFLVDVNLRFSNYDSMPPSYQIHLKSLLNTNHKSITCVYANQEERNIKLLTLFKSARVWYTRLKSLKMKKHPKSEVPLDAELKRYPNLETYLRIVLDEDIINPSPNVSDKCFMRLAENEENTSAERTECRLPQVCHDMLIDGSNHGYALTHRFLLLIAANYGRGCYIFSEEQDKAMRDKFCEMIYVEAHFIAENGFKLADLLLEQIALCSLDGHNEFINRQWLTNLQRYQTKHGCFYEPFTQPKFFTPAAELQSTPPSSEIKLENKYYKFTNENNFLNGTCSTHVTAVAVAAISASIRFILENDDVLFVRCRT